MKRFIKGVSKAKLIQKLLKKWSTEFDLTPAEIKSWKWIMGQASVSTLSLKRALGMELDKRPILTTMLEIEDAQKPRLTPVVDPKPTPGCAWEYRLITVNGITWGSYLEVIKDQVKFKRAMNSRLNALKNKKAKELTLSEGKAAKVMSLEYYSDRFGGGSEMGFGFKWNSIPRPSRADFNNQLLFDEAMAEYRGHEDSDVELPSVSIPQYNEVGQFTHDKLFYLVTSGRSELNEYEVNEFGVDSDFHVSEPITLKPIKTVYPKDVPVFKMGLKSFGKGRFKMAYLDGSEKSYVNKKGNIAYYTPITSKPFTCLADIHEYIENNPETTSYYHQPKGRAQHSADSLNQKALCGWAAEHKRADSAFSSIDGQFDQTPGDDFCSANPSDILERLEEAGLWGAS